MWAYWPINLFWKTFGVFPINFNHRYYSRIQIFFTTVISFACVYFFLSIPWIICRVGIKCTSDAVRILKEIYPGSINVASTLSRIALLYSVKLTFRKYKETLENSEAFAPTTVAETKLRKLFTFTSVTLCFLLIVPPNISRLTIFLNADKIDGYVLMLYMFIYFQNITMCCSETQFAEQCFVLYRMLKKINGEIVELKEVLRKVSKQVDASRTDVPETTTSSSSTPAIDVDTKIACHTVRLDEACSIVHAIETLRIRHWLVREAIGCLNGLFGVQMGMSVCVLCVMLFFEIYYATFHASGKLSPPTPAVYLGLLQYTVRYMGIILMSHLTTNQVIYYSVVVFSIFFFWEF